MAPDIDAVELTRRLIGFNTINPPGDERDCARYLGGLLEQADFTVSYYEFAERRTSLVARRGGAANGKPLCLTGHIDTVPLGARPWSVDPFAGETADGRLYGRGASDMKSGVAAIVAAAVRLADRLDQGPGVVLVITAGEEVGCDGAFDLARRGDALGEVSAVIVAEPTANYPLAGHKGALWLNASTSGVTAHGSMPDKGLNAIYKAGRVVAKLEDFDFNQPPHPVMGRPTLNLGTITGGMNINSVPDYTELGIDIRTVPGMDHARLSEGLEGYLKPELAELTAVVDVGPVWTEPDEPFVQFVFEVLEPFVGERPQPGAAAYFTDASALTPAYDGAPTVILGPGEPAMAHQTDEYCNVERIGQAVEAYATIITRWRGG